MKNFPERSISRRQFLRITAVAGISLVLSGSVVKTLLESSKLHKIQRTRMHLGTFVTISVVHPSAAKAGEIVDRAFDEIDRLESMLSRYRPESVVSRLNRDGIVDSPPVEAVAVIEESLKVSALSSGAFDITMKPLLDLTQRQFRKSGLPPGRGDLDRALELVDYRNLALDADRIEFKRTGMSVSVDGIAKGYVVDKAVATMKQLGADNVLVDAGGDFALTGSSESGDGWTIGIENPRTPNTMLGSVRLKDRSIATSGDYVHNFTDDRSSHHIIDPRTGRSPSHSSSTTVIARTAMEADAASTAAFVLGSVEGIDLLNRLSGVEGIVIDKNQSITKSSNFDSFVV